MIDLVCGYPDAVCSCVCVNTPEHEFAPCHLTQSGGNSGIGVAQAPGTITQQAEHLTPAVVVGVVWMRFMVSYSLRFYLLENTDFFIPSAIWYPGSWISDFLGKDHFRRKGFTLALGLRVQPIIARGLGGGHVWQLVT